MDSEEHQLHVLDLHIRSAAACISSCNTHTSMPQFVGRRILTDTFCAALSQAQFEHVVIDGRATDKAVLLGRLHVMLRAGGLAHELHHRHLDGTLSSIVLPEHNEAFNLHIFPNLGATPQYLDGDHTSTPKPSPEQEGKMRQEQATSRSTEAAEQLRSPSDVHVSLLTWVRQRQETARQAAEKQKCEGAEWSTSARYLYELKGEEAPSRGAEIPVLEQTELDCEEATGLSTSSWGAEIPVLEQTELDCGETTGPPTPSWKTVYIAKPPGTSRERKGEEDEKEAAVDASKPQKPMASESNISPISTPSTPGSESNISPVPTPSTPAPTLEPPSISLPYAVQHLVLQTLQTLLEHACHKYLQTTHPQLLVQKRWRIPQCAELNVYIHEILATGDFGLRNSELEKLSDIRHIAVHREPISEDRLEELMLAASTGALRLGDCKGKEKIARLEAIVRERQEARNEASGVIRNFEERLKYLKNLKECILRETEALEADVSYMRDLRDGNVADDICGLKAEIDDVLFDEVYRFRGAGIQDFTKILKRTMYQGFENFLDEEEMKRFDFHRESGR